MGRKYAVAWLSLMTVAWVFAGLLGCLMAGFSAMIFDAPGSGRDPAAILLFLSVISFPLACAAAIVLEWRFYRANRLREACWSSLLPLVSPLAATVAVLAENML